MEKLLEIIKGIEDVRQEWKASHKLKDIVVIVLLGTLANADDRVELEIFGQKNERMLKKYIELENVIPSHDTI
jgi:hypothetical protein